jgi:hypothetical protein
MLKSPKTIFVIGLRREASPLGHIAVIAPHPTEKRYIPLLSDSENFYYF